MLLHVSPRSKAYTVLCGPGALVVTYFALLIVLTAGAALLNADVKRFAVAFTVVFAIAYASWIVGSYANFAAVTPADLHTLGITWSLKLTNEGGYIFVLLAGLVIANFFPRFAGQGGRRRHPLPARLDAPLLALLVAINHWSPAVL